MEITAPEWLTKRTGSLKPGLNPTTCVLTLGGHPAYRLSAIPAGGFFTCAITQSNNGRRLDGSRSYPNVAAALAGGLEELREKLGW